MLKFKNIADNYFIETYIPSLMYAKAIGMLNDIRVIYMNDYLKENYKITVKDVIDQVANNYEINYEDNYTVLKLNNSTKEEKSQVKLSALVRLINDGNLDIKGTGMLNSIKGYIHDNVDVIYSTYLYGKERGDVS